MKGRNNDSMLKYIFNFRNDLQVDSFLVQENKTQIFNRKGNFQNFSLHKTYFHLLFDYVVFFCFFFLLLIIIDDLLMSSSFVYSVPEKKQMQTASEEWKK